MPRPPLHRICFIANCGGKHFGHGYCSKHYQRWVRFGDPLITARSKPKPNCSVPGCPALADVKGLCRSHYGRQRKYGYLDARRPSQGEPLRFLREIAATHREDVCVPWPYGRANYGYAEVLVDGKKRLAHRIVCELVYGPPPSGKNDCAHKCHNRLCIAPAHLRWASRAENVEDMETNGTYPRGEQNNGAKLTEDQVREIRALESRMSRNEIAAQFGISYSAVYGIHTRKVWGWLA